MGAVGGHGTEELRLQKADVVLVDVHFREHVLEHRGQDVARVDDFVHARGALALERWSWLHPALCCKSPATQFRLPTPGE